MHHVRTWLEIAVAFYLGIVCFGLAFVHAATNRPTPPQKVDVVDIKRRYKLK